MSSKRVCLQLIAQQSVLIPASAIITEPAVFDHHLTSSMAVTEDTNAMLCYCIVVHLITGGACFDPGKSPDEDRLDIKGWSCSVF